MWKIEIIIFYYNWSCANLYDFPKSTNCRRPVTSMTERMEEFELMARWWGREGRV